ncbi:hypothetical protein [Flavobacterium aquidurense]|uniref:Ig-like domain-containing protein n=1 Tax=Flavobacterium aquidurense TaxID=362413 RepID=A0A0Q0W0W4_9FLAO|nr:hypothetical protein [Flavobacterium aquidurense]KQB40123.1 hypothetical protein RC62_807 [Flavobacterium aquidurense]
MKTKLFYMWLLFVAILFSINANAQMTVGGKKAPEPFSVLELLNKGGLRLPQMTTAERNAFAVKNNDKGEGLTIYNKTTGCVEYWNKARWVSLCEGTSQTTISPQPCIDVATDGTGCDSTFIIEDPDCPNGPFNFTIVAGSEYASLYNVDTANGKFQIAFNENVSVYTRSVLVRVTSTCNSSYKEFLFSQKGVDCGSMSYTVPTVSPSASNLTLCVGGAAYLSVPANTANIDKIIWTRNGIEVARGVSYFIATQKGKYNVSMGAIGCNSNTANERNVTESGTAAAGAISILSTNNGVICGNNAVKLTALGVTANVVWFHNGVQEKSGTTISLNAAGDEGIWFAAIQEGNCYSKASNSVIVSRSTTTNQVAISDSDALVNGKALNSFTVFCKGGSLDLSVANKRSGVTYVWYNGSVAITSNPFIIPSDQTSVLLRLEAIDNAGLLCSKEVGETAIPVNDSGAPAQPDITGNNVLCDGTTDLTIVPQTAGTYTYAWYKDGVKMAETTPTITVTTPGVVYTASVTNATGCSSTMATKTISPNVSSLPVLSWVSKPATATFGAKVTLQTSIEFGPAVSYTWTASNGATVIGSGANVSIQLPATGADNLEVEIKATAVNACGNSAALPHKIVVNNVCPTPSIIAQAATEQTITSGASAQVSVSVIGGVNPTYQWYSNTTGSTSEGAIISGATSASLSYKPAGEGTSYVYCVVTNGCVGNLNATSTVFTIMTQVNPDTLPAGTGTLGGKTCFDIAESNDNATCGKLTTRITNKSDFNLIATNTQTYTFTPIGTVSKVRFRYVESVSGVIVKSFSSTASESAMNISGAVTATMVYKNTLSSPNGTTGTGAAYGKTEATALAVTIYAVYNDKADGTGKDLQVKLTAKIKDCICCGAMISATVWKNFMCHNLGADQSLDPFAPAPGLVGAYYEYGKKTPFATVYGPESVKGTSPTAGSPYAWGDGVTKSADDPCPSGYRVPGGKDWQGIASFNTLVNVSGYPGGTLVGQSMYLPYSGMKSGQYWGGYGQQANYWPANISGANTGTYYVTPLVIFTPSTGRSGIYSNIIANVAHPIRCIEEN